MAEGTIKRLTDRGFGFITREAKKTCFSTHRASKVAVLTTCKKARRCRTRKAGVQKARVPRTSSRFSSARTCRVSKPTIDTSKLSDQLKELRLPTFRELHPAAAEQA